MARLEERNSQLRAFFNAERYFQPSKFACEFLFLNVILFFLPASGPGEKRE